MSFVEFSQELVELAIEAEEKEEVIKILSDKLLGERICERQFLRECAQARRGLSHRSTHQSFPWRSATRNLNM